MMRMFAFLVLFCYHIGSSSSLCTQDNVISGSLPKFYLDDANATVIHFNESSQSIQDCVNQCCNEDLCDVVFIVSGICLGFQCESDDACRPTGSALAASMSRVRRSAKPNLIAVTISGPTVIQLKGNDDNATFYAFVDGSLADASLYTFQWRLIESLLLTTVTPKTEQTRSVDEKSFLASDHWNLNRLVISKLSPGNFTIEVEVNSNKVPVSKGIAQAKFRVLPVLRQNHPPIAVISPVNTTTVEGSAVLLDGSQSSDVDGDKLTYKWEPISGPAISGVYQTESSMLKFDSLSPGFYRFGLIVTDSQDAKSKMTEATVEVTKQRDDRPHAVAGQCESKIAGSFTVKLPLDAIHLCANDSTDDHGIVAYQWARIDEDSTSPQADLQGTAKPVLMLTNMKPGSYTFRLTVTDTSGQTDSTTITVVVNSADNLPPVANPGKNVQKEISSLNTGHSVILNGSLSTDDVNITSYNWKQFGGPKSITIVNADKPVATASGLDEIGNYTFVLNVTDTGNLSSTASVVYTIVRGTNAAPVLRIANSTIVKEVCQSVKLNACESTDDAGIVNWYWSAMPQNDADQRILSGLQSHCSVHVPCNRVNATASYNITICDAAPLCVTRIIDVKVEPNDADNETIEILVGSPVSEIENFKITELSKKLAALISSGMPSVRLVVHSVKQMPRQPVTLIEAHFIGDNLADGKSSIQVLNADKAIADLNGSIKSLQTQYNIIEIRTKYCKKTCSEHGTCDNYTHECICDRYWMPNLLARFFLSSSNECDWSVLYFTISMIVLLVALTGYCWRGRLLTLTCRHCCGLRYKFDDGRRTTASRRSARSYAAKTARYYNKKKEQILRKMEAGSVAQEESKLLSRLTNGTRGRDESTSGSTSTEDQETSLLVDVSPARLPANDANLKLR